MAGISDASTSRELEEKPSPRGDPAPLPRGPVPARERKATPARGSSTPVETLFAPARGSSITNETLFSPAWGASTTVEIFFAHAHSKGLIFDYFHRAGAIFLSQRHPERPPGATQGRSFFHAAPSGPQREPAALPGRGARGWRGLAGQRVNAQSTHQRPGTAGVKGAGGTGGPGCGARGRWRARPGFRATRQPHASTPGPTGVEGAGGICRGAGGRWRGLAGLRGDAPSEARSADGSRAGRRPRAQPAARPNNTPRGARNTNGATRHVATTKPPSPTGAGRLRQSAREGQRRITTMSGSPRPLS